MRARRARACSARPSCPCAAATSQCSIARRAARAATDSYSAMSPGREHARHGRLEPRRAAHAAGLAELEARAAREHHVGHHAGADHHAARSRAPGRPSSPPSSRARRRPRSARARPTPCTSTPCSSSTALDEAARPPRPRLALERDLLQHQDRAASAERGQRRRHLAADVAAADQHDVVGRRRRPSRIASAFANARR